MVTMAEQCIFCSIVAGEAPAEVIYEDEHTVAFLDINPWARGHTLVVPRRHSTDLYEIDQKDLEQTLAAAKQVAKRVNDRLNCDGIMLLNSSGAAAWQVVPHFHVHVIPRYPDDGFTLPGPGHADANEIRAAAAELRG
jgi:histidine triad (HIT) family protein